VKRKKIKITVDYGNAGIIIETLHVVDIKEAIDLVSKYNGMIIAWREIN